MIAEKARFGGHRRASPFEVDDVPIVNLTLFGASD